MTQEPPPCKPCQIAREFPEYRMFNPQEVTALRKATLADWLQHGHSEAQIRALVKGPMAVAPPTPATPSASAPLKPGRPR